MTPYEPVVIVMADDDPDDRMLAGEAFEASKLLNELRFVSDGVELMDYLKKRAAYADPASAPRPGFILLDLNMPRMDGREALELIKGDPELRDIPVVVLTTSKAEEDVMRSYFDGANSFITKPVDFEGLMKVVASLGAYWLEIVQLPTVRRGNLQ